MMESRILKKCRVWGHPAESWMLPGTTELLSSAAAGIRKARDYARNGKMGSVCFIRIDINPAIIPP